MIQDFNSGHPKCCCTICLSAAHRNMAVTTQKNILLNLQEKKKKQLLCLSEVLKKKSWRQCFSYYCVAYWCLYILLLKTEYSIIWYKVTKFTWTQNQIFSSTILITTIIIHVVKQKATWSHGNVIRLFFTLNYMVFHRNTWQYWTIKLHIMQGKPFTITRVWNSNLELTSFSFLFLLYFYFEMIFNISFLQFISAKSTNNFAVYL